MSDAPSGWQTPVTNHTPDNGVTDEIINRVEGNTNAIETGNRVIPTNEAPSGSIGSPVQGSLRTLLKNIVNRFFAIIGGDWRSIPITLQATKTHVDATAPHSGHAKKTEFDNHVASSAVHNATASPTAGRIVMRNIHGRTKMADPVEGDDVINLKTTEDLIAETYAGAAKRQYNAKVLSSAGWYRIAENRTAANKGDRAFGTFIIFDTTSGRHHLVQFNAGIAHNRADYRTFGVLANTRYGTATFTKVRILRKDTYDPQYLEVYVSDAANCTVVLQDNEWTSGWKLLNWTTGGIPSGYVAHEYADLAAGSGFDVDSADYASSALDLKWAYPGDLMVISSSTERFTNSAAPSNVLKAFRLIHPGYYRITGELKASDTEYYAHVGVGSQEFKTKLLEYQSFQLDMGQNGPPVPYAGILNIHVWVDEYAPYGGAYAFIRNVEIKRATTLGGRPEWLPQIVID